ncbi:hypothetical protein UFOVP49_88 [uncultured Caudovirales phage]|uniref:Uncharacterized protein n=1 Tax=uncultured Caudovirales phage TaxID=2100421 RepID=A0A6J5KVL3_9CAUD|nr:hypothetical protein UFOVP49_88 [uncultured Caudovirales phage]
MASLGTVNVVGYPTNPADTPPNVAAQSVASFGRQGNTTVDPASQVGRYLVLGSPKETMTPNGGRYTKFPTAP